MPKFLEKLKTLHVIDVGDMKFRDCPLPRTVTFGQILGEPRSRTKNSVRIIFVNFSRTSSFSQPDSRK